jgi:amylovoran biosynthesis glycosyltransferase AmsD
MKQKSGAGGRRVTFIAADLSTGGGVNKVIRDLAVLFKRRLGADVTVVNARSNRPSTYPFPADVHVQLHRRQSPISYFRLLLSLRASRPHVVISSWTQDNILATLAFLFSRSKVVVVEHSSWHFHRPGIRWLRRMVYPLAAAVVVLNRADLDHYRRFLANVRLIPDPVSASPSTPTAKEKLILAVGHLEPLKQFDHAIRAMAQSGLEHEGWSLVIVGSGSEERRLTGLIAELGLKNTHIVPPTDDLGPWYARASLLLLTSRLESFSLVLAEGMLAGAVPIAYATDGPAFILEDFPEHLVPIGDVQGLTGQISRLATQPGLDSHRTQMRRSIERRFSPDVVSEQWRDLLDSL